jgi:hypothetical protein
VRLLLLLLLLVVSSEAVCGPCVVVRAVGFVMEHARRLVNILKLCSSSSGSSSSRGRVKL